MSSTIKDPLAVTRRGSNKRLRASADKGTKKNKRGNAYHSASPIFHILLIHLGGKKIDNTHKRTPQGPSKQRKRPVPIQLERANLTRSAKRQQLAAGSWLDPLTPSPKEQRDVHTRLEEDDANELIPTEPTETVVRLRKLPTNVSSETY